MANENNENGAAGAVNAGNGAQPALNVLAQYVKDLSFESPGAPNTLRSRDKAPNIAINVNVNANPMSGTEYDVTLTLNAKATVDESVLFNVELPEGTRPAGALHRVPAASLPVRAPDHRRLDAQWRLPAADARPDRFRADVPAEDRRGPGAVQGPGQLTAGAVVIPQPA